MARYGAQSATFGGVVFKKAKIWGGCFGYWKIQNGPSVFHIDPLHGLIWPRCKGQFSPKFWYQNSPISVGLNWPQKQYHSGLTRFGPIFGAKLALFILQCKDLLGNLRWRRFLGDGDRTGRESLELRQPSLPVKNRTLRSQWTQKDGAFN